MSAATPELAAESDLAPELVAAKAAYLEGPSPEAAARKRDAVAAIVKLRNKTRSGRAGLIVKGDEA